MSVSAIAEPEADFSQHSQECIPERRNAPVTGQPNGAISGIFRRPFRR
jgi:hypothetical protein